MGLSRYPTLGFDPTPGDPEGVTTLAGEWQDAAFLMIKIAMKLDSTEDAQARWRGKAADAFRSKLSAQRVMIGKLRASYEDNAALLTGWAGQLTEFQREAAALELRAAGLDEKRRCQIIGPQNIPVPMLQASPAPPGQTPTPSIPPEQLQEEISGVHHQAEQLHERYLDAARALARTVENLLPLPTGNTGWYGQDIDAAQESMLVQQEATRKGGPVPVDPALRAIWWNSLTSDEQAVAAREYANAPAADVYSTQGLPAGAADRLNRLRLQAEVRKPGCPQRLKDLWDRLTNKHRYDFQDDVFLLGFDDVGNGHVAVSFGNPDTSSNTAVYVPGTGSSLDKANGDLNRAQTLYASANSQNPHSTASVYWLGYDAPGWDVPGPASQSFADAGAPKLAAFVNSLGANHRGAGHLTVIGHSYGSTLVGDAFAHAGMKADDVIFVGSPGVTVDSASQLGLDPSHVWASKAKFDPVPEISAPLNPLKWTDDHSVRYGNDPTSTAFGGRTFDAGDGTRVGHAHSEYWDPGPSLDNMTRIVTGQPDRVTAMPTEHKVGVLPNLADLPVPVIAAPEFGGAALQNLGHHVGGYWGKPMEDAGDALHEFGQAENNVVNIGGDLLTGDLHGVGTDAKDLGSDLKDSGKNAIKTVTDFF
ncbi:alpha/beta hydrolase [Streptomyces sp. NPDC008317]|uniref:alpha/beta hydrolase n=1 Tax=Streptomyces sp. NPDC008317 TaxID=3364827 RepID=UPI0036E243AC